MIEELAAYRAAKPLYAAAKDGTVPGEYDINCHVRLIGTVKKGEPYIAEVAARADPWKLLAVALSKLNGVTIESIVKESLSWNSHDNAVIKAAATAAIKRIVASHKDTLDGRITGKVVLEVL